MVKEKLYSKNNEILGTYSISIFIFAFVAITFTIVYPVPIDTFPVFLTLISKGIVRTASELE